MKQRQAVTAVTGQRYRQGSKKVKQQILDEFCETTGYCRGYARFVLRNHGRQVWLREKRVMVGDVRERRQRQKPKYYNEAVVQELVKLWQLAWLGYLPGTAQHREQHRRVGLLNEPGPGHAKRQHSLCIRRESQRRPPKAHTGP